MRSRATRTVAALFFSVFIAISAVAAPDGRNESGDWVSRNISLIVHQLAKFFSLRPFDDPSAMPPKP